MTMMQRLGGVSLCIAVIGMMSTACDDNDESDTNAQTADGGENNDASVRGNTGGNTARAGRGGSGGATSRAGAGGGGGTSASAGNGGSGGATTGTTGGSGGGGGTTATAGRGGAGGTSATGGTGGTGGSAGNAGTGGATSTTLNDAQIAAVTTTANTGEINLAMLALTRAQLPAVRAFAQMMIDMHGAAQTRQNLVLDALDLEISANPVSAQLESDAMQVTTQLNAAAANTFDLTYIRSQVDIHTKVLSIVDNQLLPSVSAAALRADLMLTRAEVAAHLAAARVLLDQLEDLSDAGVP